MISFSRSSMLIEQESKNCYRNSWSQVAAYFPLNAAAHVLLAWIRNTHISGNSEAGICAVEVKIEMLSPCSCYWTKPAPLYGG